MEYTDLWTKNGFSFVKQGCNLVTSKTTYVNIQPETLKELGYIQKVNITLSNEEPFSRRDEMIEIDGQKYYAHYITKFG